MPIFGTFVVWPGSCCGAGGCVVWLALVYYNEPTWAQAPLEGESSAILALAGSLGYVVSSGLCHSCSLPPLLLFGKGLL